MSDSTDDVASEISSADPLSIQNSSNSTDHPLLNSASELDSAVSPISSIQNSSSSDDVSIHQPSLEIQGPVSPTSSVQNSMDSIVSTSTDVESSNEPMILFLKTCVDLCSFQAHHGVIKAPVYAKFQQMHRHLLHLL